MPTIIGDAYVRVRPDAGNFKGEVESKVNSPLRSAVKIASAIAVGTGVVAFLKSSVSGAMEFQSAMAQVNGTLDNVGQGTDKAKLKAENYVKALADLGSFSREQVAAGLNRATLGVGNLGKGMQVETVAANLSRKAHMDLSRTTLLVTKAWEGNTTGLKRLGISFNPVTTAADNLKARIAALTKEHDSATGSTKKLIAEQIKGVKAQLDAAKASDKQATILAVQKRLTDISTNGMKIFADTTAGRMAAASHAIDNLKDNIGQALLPVIGHLADFATAAINKLNTNWPRIRKAAEDAIKPLEPAFHAVSAVIQEVVTYVRGLIDRFMEMQGHSDAIKAALAVIAIAIAAVTTQVVLMNLAFLANPFVLVVLAIAALVGSLVFAYEHFKTFRDIVNEVFGFLQSYVPTAIAVAKAALESLISAAQAVAAAVGPVFDRLSIIVKQAMDDIKTAVAIGWPIIEAIFTAVAPVIAALFSAVWAPLKTIITGAFNVMKTTLTTALNVLSDVIQAFNDVLHGKWGAAWGQLKNAVKDAMNGAISVIRTTLGSAATAATQLGVGIAKAIWVGIKSVAGLLGDLSSIITSGIESAIGRVLAYAGDLAVGIGTAIVHGAISGITGLAGAIKSAVERGIKSGLSHVLPFSPIEEGAARLIGLPIITGTVAGIGKNAKSIDQILNLTVRRAFEGLGVTITDASAKPTDATKAFVDRIGNQVKGIADKISAEQGRIKTAFESVTGTLFGAFDARTQQLLNQNTKWWENWGANLTSIAKTATDELTLSMNAALKSNTDALDAATQQIDDTLKNQLAAIADTQKVATPAEAALKALQAGHDQAARDSSLADAQAALQTATRNRDKAGMLAAQKQIDDALYNQKVFDLGVQATAERTIADAAATDATAAAQLTHDTDLAAAKEYYANQATALTEYWNGQITTVQNRLAAELAMGEAQRATEQLDLSSDREYRKGILTGIGTDLEAKLASHKITWETAHKKLMKMFKDDLGPDYRTAAANLGEMFATGLGDADEKIAKAAGQLAQTVAKYLKTKSPTELGPMSSLDTWWANLPDTLAAGVDTRRLGGIVGDITTPAFAGGAATRSAAPWDEDAFIQKLAKAIGDEMPHPASPLSIAVTDNAAATAAALARAAVR